MPAPPKPTVRVKKVRLGSAAEVAAAANDGVEDGYTDVTYSYDPPSVSVEQNADGSYTASGDVNVEIYGPGSEIEVTEWSYPGSRGDTKLADANATLREHEEGHWGLAQKAADENSGKVTGTGATPQEAKDDLQKKADEKLAAAEAARKKAWEEYDKQTDHGKKQKGCQNGTVFVQGYTRDDGTYVHPYTRSCPNR
jgi:hypothetical protein